MIELKHTSAKSLRIRVDRKGNVKVSVPSLVPLSTAEQVVKDNIDWVKEQLVRRSESTCNQAPLSEATTVLLWGEDIPFTLVRETGRKRITTKQTDDGIVIHAPEDVTEDDLETALDRILNAELETRVNELAPILEARIGKHAAMWRFRRMVSRWGSCNTKTAGITLNTALAELDPVFLEYVMCHELSHLWEGNHSSSFYQHLEAACPNWRELRNEIKRYETLL